MLDFLQSYYELAYNAGLQTTSRDLYDLLNATDRNLSYRSDLANYMINIIMPLTFTISSFYFSRLAFGVNLFFGLLVVAYSTAFKEPVHAYMATDWWVYTSYITAFFFYVRYGSNASLLLLYIPVYMAWEVEPSATMYNLVFTFLLMLFIRHTQYKNGWGIFEQKRSLGSYKKDRVSK